MKKFISTILLMVMLVESLSISSFAEGPTDAKNEKSNLIVSVETEDYMEYTYEEAGEQYLVKESINLTKDEVSTQIFMNNKNNNYELVDKYVTRVLVIDGNIKVNIIKDDKIIDSYTLQIDITPDFTVSTRTTPPPPADGKAGWSYATTVKGSTKIMNMSISAIKTVLKGVLTGMSVTLFGKPAGIATAMISEIATDLFIREADYAYFKQSIYYYFPSNSKIPTKGKTFTNTYADSQYRVFLGEIEEEFSVILGGN